MASVDGDRPGRTIRVLLGSEDGSAGDAPRIQALSRLVALARDGLVALAVLVGGGWALVRYDLIESNAAKVRYELDLQTSKAQVQVTAQSEQRVVRDGDRFIVAGRLTLRNVGSRDVVVRCDASAPVTLYRLDTAQAAPTPIRDSRVEAYFLAEDGMRQDYASIDIGNAVALPFAVVAPAPGLYLLNVAVPVSAGDLSRTEKDAGPGWTWSDQHILDLR